MSEGEYTNMSISCARAKMLVEEWFDVFHETRVVSETCAALLHESRRNFPIYFWPPARRRWWQARSDFRRAMKRYEECVDRLDEISESLREHQQEHLLRMI